MLIASERIVEQMMPEKEEESKLPALKAVAEVEESREGDLTTKGDSISLVSGEDGEAGKVRSKMRKLNLHEDDVEYFDEPSKMPKMKKRRFKELQKYSLDDTFGSP